jgi:hypothetical protein
LCEKTTSHWGFILSTGAWGAPLSFAVVFACCLTVFVSERPGEVLKVHAEYERARCGGVVVALMMLVMYFARNARDTSSCFSFAVPLAGNSASCAKVCQTLPSRQFSLVGPLSSNSLIFFHNRVYAAALLSSLRIIDALPFSLLFIVPRRCYCL